MNPARRRVLGATALALGMVLGGAGAAYFFFASDAPSPVAAAPGPAVPRSEGSPESLARAVVDRLNAKDLDGVIELTCAQGKNTGRRELIRALPPLDPSAPASTRSAAMEFQLKDVNEFAEGYVAGIAVSYQGASHEGKMRIQRSGDAWTLCGMDSPQLTAIGPG